MKQLGILDSAFINLEQTNTPQHIGGLGIYDPSTAPGGFVRFKDVIANFERRLSRLPLFRTRLVEVPGGIDRPYWIKDAHFDVEFHLRHIALPEPGDWRQLCILVARLHSRPLDMARPLWEAYIIEGLDKIPNLPPGCFAVYTKMHHSLVDGAGGSTFIAALHDLEPVPSQTDSAEEGPHLVDSTPSVTELLSRASLNTVKNAMQLATGSAKSGVAIGKYALDIGRNKIPAPDLSAPKTRFNKAVGPHRVFDAAEFPLAGFKAIRRAAGVTLNDVALGVIGGALQGYLQEKGEAPGDGSLAAAMPLNMRTRREMSDDNNQVGSVFATLATDIDDPLARLQAIKQSTEQAKSSGENSPMVDTLKLAGVFSPFLTKAIASFWARNELSRFIPMNVTTCISNVPGPSFPLYCAGSKMVDYYGLGVLTPGMGLFHLVFSYSGTISLSILADRDILPDPERYHDLLVESYRHIYRSVVGQEPDMNNSAASDQTLSPKRGANSEAAESPAPKSADKARGNRNSRGQTRRPAKRSAKKAASARKPKRKAGTKSPK
ncbi:MAG: wax ester/triacylglycerol synthase family O-acyltransferase [Pseudomonadota bacterium]